MLLSKPWWSRTKSTDLLFKLVPMLRLGQHRITVWLVCTALLAGHVATASAPTPSAACSTPAATVLQASRVAQEHSTADHLRFSKQRYEPAMHLHGTQQLLVFSTVKFLEHAAGNSASADGSSARTATQQQRACISIRAVLLPLQAASAKQALSTKSDFEQSASLFKICSKTRDTPPKPTAASSAAATPLVQEFVLLVPLQETNTTPAAKAASHTTTDISSTSSSEQAQSSSTSGAAPAAASQPLVLTLYAEQQLGRTTYLWTASHLVTPGAATLNAVIDMRIFAYSWTVPPPAAPAPTAPCKPCPAANNTAVTAAAAAAATGSVQEPHVAPAAAATTAINHSTASEPNQQHQKCPIIVPAAAANSSSSSTSCFALQQLLPACGAWSPADAAYAVAALLHRHPEHAVWTGSTLLARHDSNSSSSSASSDCCPAWPNDMLPAFMQGNNSGQSRCDRPIAPIPEQQSTSSSNSSVEPASSGAAGTAAAGAPLLSFDSSTRQLTINASPVQLLLATAVLALLAFLAGRAVSKPSSTSSSPAPATGHAGTTSGDYQLAQQQQQQQQRKQNDSYELPDASRYDQHNAPGRNLSAAAGGQSSDPFGYGDTAAAAAAATAARDVPGGGHAAAVVSAVRRASAMAVGRAAGTLKDAFAGRAAAPTAGPGPSTAFKQAIAAGGSTQDAAAAAMWDEADEDVVNELPASIQAHLQAGGRWARDKGGRLVRGSINALRAASTMAAGALMQANGEGAAAAAGAAGVGAGWDSGGYGQQQQQGQNAGAAGGAAAAGGFVGGGEGAGGRSDAVLLRRLMMSGPGTELVLSDEEA